MASAPQRSTAADDAEQHRGAQRIERVAPAEQRAEPPDGPGSRRTGRGAGHREAQAEPAERARQRPRQDASGTTVKTGLSAKTGPTIEMSPRELARASRLAMPDTKHRRAGMAGHARAGRREGLPVTTKKRARR